MKILALIIFCSVTFASNLYAKKFYYKDHFLTYYSNHSSDKKNSEIERLIVVVHGALRNGDDYFEHAIAAAKIHNVAKSSLIIAPHFRRASDPRKEGEIYYGNRWYTKWKYGYRSQDSDNVSSFTLIDKLIKHYVDSKNFPNLKNIIITGHSAGGQFTQRYAVGSRLRLDVSQRVQFIPSNPSSYMYLDPDRFHFKNGNYQLKKPDENCNEYNDYIYGPKNRASYLANLNINELKENFEQNNVTYLMSEQDIDTDMLDRSCEAMLQGKNRFQRAMNFWHYENKILNTQNHSFVSIANIGHDHEAVFNSKEAGRVIFGRSRAQSSNYLYRKIGNMQNTRVPKQSPLFALMGGGKNNLNGFSDFLKAALNGDLIVISAKDKLYHRYTFDLWNMALETNIPISSVETISVLNKEAGSNQFIIDRVKKADAIFFTGGNQAKYINRIKGTKLHKQIIEKVKQGTPIAGTSAGLAILGEYIFSAKLGGISSAHALSNPESPRITIENDFFYSDLLANMITDTHFMNRNREGRLLAFMNQTQRQYKVPMIFGIGVDEATTLTIREKSMNVHGDVYLYRKINRPNKSLNYGPVHKLKLISGKKYPHYTEMIHGEGQLLQVRDGQIIKEESL